MQHRCVTHLYFLNTIQQNVYSSSVLLTAQVCDATTVAQRTNAGYIKKLQHLIKYPGVALLPLAFLEYWMDWFEVLAQAVWMKLEHVV